MRSSELWSQSREESMICDVFLFLFQKLKATAVWTWTLVISLFIESCHAQKVKLSSYSHFPFVSCTTPSYQSKLLSSFSWTSTGVLSPWCTWRANVSLSTKQTLRDRSELNWICVNQWTMLTLTTLHIIRFPDVLV